MTKVWDVTRIQGTQELELTISTVSVRDHIPTQCVSFSSPTLWAMLWAVKGAFLSTASSHGTEWEWCGRLCGALRGGICNASGLSLQNCPLLSSLYLVFWWLRSGALNVICVLMALIIFISSLGFSPALHTYSTFPPGFPVGIPYLTWPKLNSWPSSPKAAPLSEILVFISQQTATLSFLLFTLKSWTPLFLQWPVYHSPASLVSDS